MITSWKGSRRQLPLSLAVALLVCGGAATAQERFLRGDANNDKQVDVSDPVCVLVHLFLSSEGACGSPGCMDAADTNDDGGVDISDAAYLLSFLFQGGPAPPAPGPDSCGPDPSTEDALGCETSPACEPNSCPLIRVSLVGEQRNPDLAVDDAGGVIVVWESDRDADGFFEIDGVAYGPDGTERLERFTVNDSSSGQQLRPAVAMDASGGFVAVWEHDGSDGDGLFNIRARGFNADGTERFPEFEVNTADAGQQQSPDVAADAAGNFVVVWQDDQGVDGLFNIEARVFNADGSERVPQFTVNDSNSGQQTDPVTAMDAAGNFVVVWEHDGDEDGRFNVRASGFNPDGTARLAEFKVHEDQDDTGQQLSPAIAMERDGKFVVAWEHDGSEDGRFSIRARGFHADGAPRIPEGDPNPGIPATRFFDVNINSGHQLSPSMAVNATGEIAAAFHEDRHDDGMDEFHIRLRAFLPPDTETNTFPHTQADCVEPAQHRNPAIGIDGSERIWIFWEDTGESQPTQVVGRRYPDPGVTPPQAP